LERWSEELLNHISSHLINLEQLQIYENGYEYGYYSGDNTDFIVKFSQPTKIKKLILDWGSLSSCSLNSILLNCPNLEELDLNRWPNRKEPNYVKFLNLSNPSKIKKLSIDCYALSEGVFNTLLLKCSHLNELSINLPVKWKEAIKSIYETCADLERLNILPPNGMHGQELYGFFRELYETEFFTCSPKCKYTLSHLTLGSFEVQYSKAEYFKNFEKLKSIKFLNQYTIDIKSPNIEAEIDKDLWLGYKLLITDGDSGPNVEIKRY
jgi:hypothetical protein